MRKLASNRRRYQDTLKMATTIGDAFEGRGPRRCRIALRRSSRRAGVRRRRQFLHITPKWYYGRAC
eukprot:3633591-Pyramimonas_sp.AAC.1